MFNHFVFDRGPDRLPSYIEGDELEEDGIEYDDENIENEIITNTYHHGNTNGLSGHMTKNSSPGSLNEEHRKGRFSRNQSIEKWRSRVADEVTSSDNDNAGPNHWGEK